MHPQVGHESERINIRHQHRSRILLSRQSSPTFCPVHGCGRFIATRHAFLLLYSQHRGSRHSESPTMSPHHALQTADIVRLTFETFDDAQFEDRRFCARAASVCRAFNEPASRVAWTRLTSMIPLWATPASSSCTLLRISINDIKRGCVAEVCRTLVL